MIDNLIGKTWNNLSIKRKLIFFFTIIILSVSILYFYILNNAFVYMKMFEEDLIKTSLVHNLSTAVKANNEKFAVAVRDYNSENVEAFDNTIDRVWKSWNMVKNETFSSRDALFEIEAVRYGMLAYLESAKSSLVLFNSNKDLFSEQLLRANRIEDYIETYLDRLINVRLEESSKLHESQKEAVSHIQRISFLGILFISLLSLVFGNFFSVTLTKPIIDLASNTIKIAEGNLNVKKVSDSSHNEITVLINSFNRMSRNINQMVESLKDKANIEKQHYEDEMKLIDMGKSLREAQFLSLQSQINPHFLFNTLNTIARTSMFEQAPKTVRLIECLSNVFRYNLNNQDKAVSLKEELEILDEYMFIQQTRYGDRLKFSIDNRIDASHIRIPIFTLQPLVENAVKYGIEPKEEGGRISIDVDRIRDGILIKVEDTGIGFDIDKSRQTVNSLDSTGIGVENVKKRLALKFNGKEKFSLHSVIGEGTVVEIFIPEEADV
ncbi:sensor histidine kinase [Spirochaeta isovalerica]|uniref:Signal transduction histidine kinase n=1 Tax=Spirochaeta isovalerica TaxID=150 RepID=A0A841RBA7_9SPIO|nr:histidine kinase [Spirochaeta isovalerica]MBB6481245.1 signal transduction histidine kinase [Spirochaeta isovalerica]